MLQIAKLQDTAHIYFIRYRNTPIPTQDHGLPVKGMKYIDCTHFSFCITQLKKGMGLHVEIYLDNPKVSFSTANVANYASMLISSNLTLSLAMGFVRCWLTGEETDDLYRTLWLIMYFG